MTNLLPWQAFHLTVETSHYEAVSSKDISWILFTLRQTQKYTPNYPLYHGTRQEVGWNNVPKLFVIGTTSVISLHRSPLITPYYPVQRLCHSKLCIIPEWEKHFVSSKQTADEIWNLQTANFSCSPHALLQGPPQRVFPRDQCCPPQKINLSAQVLLQIVSI